MLLLQVRERTNLIATLLLVWLLNAYGIHVCAASPASAVAPTPGPYATSLLLPGEPLLLLPPDLVGYEVPETSAHCSATTANMQISKYLYLRHRAARTKHVNCCFQPIQIVFLIGACHVY
jgi:hypothetical protein